VNQKKYYAEELEVQGKYILLLHAPKERVHPRGAVSNYIDEQGHLAYHFRQQ
jgi:hypothetical protein